MDIRVKSESLAIHVCNTISFRLRQIYPRLKRNKLTFIQVSPPKLLNYKIVRDRVRNPSHSSSLDNVMRNSHAAHQVKWSASDRLMAVLTRYHQS